MATVRVIAGDLKENDTFKMAGEIYRVDNVRRRFSEEVIVKAYPNDFSMAQIVELVVNRELIMKITRDK